MQNLNLENGMSSINNFYQMRTYLKTNILHTGVGILMPFQKEYTFSEVLKAITFCQNPNEDKQELINMYDNLYTLNDYRLGIILNSLALCAMDHTNPSGHGLEIFVANGQSVEPILLSGDPSNDGLEGLCLYDENTIIISDFKPLEYIQYVLFHEFMHKLVHEIKEYDYDTLQKHAQSQVEEISSNDFLVNNSEEDFIKSLCYDHIVNNSFYPNTEAQLDEFAANTGAIILRGAINPEEKKFLYDAAKPMLKYFDNIILPKLEKFIVNHPLRQQLNIKNEINEKLLKRINLKNVEKQADFSKTFST